MTADSETLSKLDELMTTLKGYDDPRRASAEWKQVYKLLQGTDLPSASVTHVVGMRDVVRLAELIEQLRAPAVAPAEEVPDAETCKRALRAFRKRLAVIRLDDESRLVSRNPLSKGADTRVTAAIVPPSEWPESVWLELARQGKLIRTKDGFYELPKQ